jgi:hypothetical protein
MFNWFRDMRRFHSSLIRCFRCIILFDCFGSNSFFGDEFNRGTEEVMEKSPFFGIEFIEEWYSVGKV